MQNTERRRKTVNYKNVSDKQLIEKINNLKAEQERTADCLKQLEKELDKRKQKEPLGVPLEGCEIDKILGTYYFSFTSNKSKKLFDERLEEYVKALQKLARDESIDIKVLLPLMPKGYVAMDRNNAWHWYKEKPYISKFYGSWNTGHRVSFIGAFNIKPVEDWCKSLMECGL